MKYIVLEMTDTASTGGTMVREIPIVFPDLLVHADVEAAMRRMLRRERPDGRSREIKIVAAGFLTSTTFAGAECNGISESLKIQSRGELDTRLLTGFDYFHGIQ